MLRVDVSGLLGVCWFYLGTVLMYFVINGYRCLLEDFFSFFFFFCFFLGRTHGVWKFPSEGSDQSYSCWSTPQPQECGLWASAVTYTTGHGSAWSLAWLSEARDQTCVLMDTSQIRFPWALIGTPRISFDTGL